MKIRLQIASIGVNLLGFFLGISSTFKGRIRSNLEMIRDQSCPNWIAIESKCGGSRRTQDFAQKPLNFFMIQSRVELQREVEHRFIRKSPQKSRTVRSGEDRLDGDDGTLKMSHDPTT